MSTETEHDSLVITASGTDRVGLVDALAGKITDSGGNIEESRMAVLGGQFALIMLISGPWHALSRLESQLPATAEQLELTLIQQRTSKPQRSIAAIPYTVEVVAMDHPGIVRKLSAFFARNGINIEELQTSCYPAPHTGTPMFSVVMTLGIQAGIHIPSLRNDFLDYCDDLNLDATIEPVRN